MSSPTLRLAVVGLGTVGTWVLDAIERHRPRLRELYGIEPRVVALAVSGGLIHEPDGFDLGPLLADPGPSESLGRWPGERFPAARAGLEAIDFDLLVEVAQSAPDGEPGIALMRSALARGIPVVTSDKWPVALEGVALSELAAAAGTRLRAESTVMSGTPVLAALTEGLGLAQPLRLTGIVNATVNAICTRLEDGAELEAAVEEAKAAGLAEADPSADLDGEDSKAKVMVLAALVFGTQLRPDEVRCRGLSALAEEEIADARRLGRPLREVVELDPSRSVASVEVRPVDPSDRLARIRGTDNIVRLATDVMDPIEIVGPGAGPALAGQGAFADLVATLRERRRH